MQTIQTDTQPARTTVPSWRRASRTRVLIAVAAVLVAVLGAAFYISSTDRPVQSVEPQVQQMSPEDITADLVRRGLIPAQTLQPAKESTEEITQDLVNQGLIPSQTLEPASKSREELTRDLVRQRLIPAQTLDD